MSNPRRPPGLSTFSSSRLQSHHYTSHGATLRTRHATSLSTQLSVFQSLLHNFALTHAKEIRANPAFRAEFARMCSALGVDFLGSGVASASASASTSAAAASASAKGSGLLSGLTSSWAGLLGPSMTDFYFNLGIRIVEVCRETRAENGGLISITDLMQHIQRGRGIGSGMAVTPDDIARAVEALAPLGSCFSIMRIGHGTLIRSVARELNGDQATVLEAIQVLGYVTVGMLQVNLGWERARGVAVVEDLMAASLVWVDTQAGENEYWSPAFITAAGAA
jgi:ESCRT-II complex subunit VPS22